MYYYKCKTVGCKCNRSAKSLHEQFESLLDKYQINKSLLAPLQAQMKYTFEYFNKPNNDNKANLKYSLKKINEKIEQIEERYVIGEIDTTLYNKFANKFRVEKEEIKNISFNSSNLDLYLENSLGLTPNLHNTWKLGNYIEKQKLQKLLFPEGISYDRKNDKVRTSKINSILELTNCLSTVFDENKKGRNNKKIVSSSTVIPQGLEP